MQRSDQGLNKNRYQVIPRTLVFLTRDQCVLLLKGAPHKRRWANHYNGVGGHVERGEDVLGAAWRELREESGLEPRGLWLCGTVLVDAGEEIGVLVFVFRGDCPEGEPRPSQEGTPEWVPIENIPNLPLVEDLAILLPRVLSIHTGDPPFSARSIYDDHGRLQITFYP